MGQKKGFKHSQKTKDKIRKTLQRPRPEFRLEKHPNWTNGNINYWKYLKKLKK
jgi:hypothetical protein